MSAGADEFVKRRIYLPLERGRDLALRNLFRKVFIAGGFESPAISGAESAPVRRTRIPLAEFAAALRIKSQAEEKARIDMDEVECLLANMIYKVRISSQDNTVPQAVIGRLTYSCLSLPEYDEGLYFARACHGRT